MGEIVDGSDVVVPVNSALRFRVQMQLGRLGPQDVVVELYIGRVDMNGQLVEGTAVAMQPEGQRSDGYYTYAGETSIERSGLHGLTVRVRPSHPDMYAKFIPGLICWAAQSTVETVLV